MENTNAFEFFKEEMDVDDIAVRVNTVHKLPIIATLMTPDAIKNQLIPFLDGTSRLTQRSPRRKTMRLCSPSPRSTPTSRKWNLMQRPAGIPSADHRDAVPGGPVRARRDRGEGEGGGLD